MSAQRFVDVYIHTITELNALSLPSSFSTQSPTHKPLAMSQNIPNQTSDLNSRRPDDSPSPNRVRTSHALKNSWVLITGASSGFGEEFARQYAAQGYPLVLVARRLDKLQTLAETLR